MKLLERQSFASRWRQSKPEPLRVENIVNRCLLLRHQFVLVAMRHDAVAGRVIARANTL
jgi:hypothetical protein